MPGPPGLPLSSAHAQGGGLQGLTDLGEDRVPSELTQTRRRPAAAGRHIHSSARDVLLASDLAPKTHGHFPTWGGLGHITAVSESEQSLGPDTNPGGRLSGQERVWEGGWSPLPLLAPCALCWHLRVLEFITQEMCHAGGAGQSHVFTISHSLYTWAGDSREVERPGERWGSCEGTVHPPFWVSSGGRAGRGKSHSRAIGQRQVHMHPQLPTVPHHCSPSRPGKSRAGGSAELASGVNRTFMSSACPGDSWTRRPGTLGYEWGPQPFPPHLIYHVCHLSTPAQPGNTGMQACPDMLRQQEVCGGGGSRAALPRAGPLWAPSSRRIRDPTPEARAAPEGEASRALPDSGSFNSHVLEQRPNCTLPGGDIPALPAHASHTHTGRRMGAPGFTPDPGFEGFFCLWFKKVGILDCQEKWIKKKGPLCSARRSGWSGGHRAVGETGSQCRDLRGTSGRGKAQCTLISVVLGSCRRCLMRR